MILSDGRYQVDTATSELLATSELTKEGGGYSHETHSTYRFWKSKTGKYFITREYEEFIACWPWSKKSRKGDNVYVYANVDDARRAWREHGPVPAQLLEEI